MRNAIGFRLLFAFLVPTLAPAQPGAREILQRISDAYKSVSQYEFVARATGPDDVDGKMLEVNMHFAFKAPDRYRMEGVLPGLTFGPKSIEAVVVHDGANLWMYAPETNQYAQFAAKELTDTADNSGDLRPEAMDGFMMGRYRGAAGFAEASWLRDETVEFGGAKVDCYVLKVSQKKGGRPYTWWVDKKQSRILREDTAESSTVFSSVKLGEPLPDSLFKFQPPQGAGKLQIPR